MVDAREGEIAKPGFLLEKDYKEIAYLKIWTPGRHIGQVTCSLYLSILYTGCYSSINT